MDKNIFSIMVLVFVLFIIAFAVYFVVPFNYLNISDKGSNEDVTSNEVKNIDEKNIKMEEDMNNKNIRTIYLAGGCFWGVEGYFSRLEGVVDAESGYANGNVENTDYHNLKQTGHSETVKINYDMSVIALEEILLHYFRIIDPTSVNKQGNDVGIQYRTGVYYVNDEDKKIIDKVFEQQSKVYGELAVEKEPLRHFVVAEEYHQDYLDKNPNGYCHINLDNANKPLFDEQYKNPDDDVLKIDLDELSYSVLRESATERPHSSKLNSEYRKGIFVDKITGEPLFASKDKFDSGCGWPSFSKPILTDKINYLEDNSHGMHRVEVRSKSGDNHLGHIFNDGPAEKGGLRYCINGASLKFIPYEDMDEQGYAEYKIFCE